ncbi:MAG: SIR2 family NAD-dependent protein deacylase [Myxococcota bacterium]
MNERTAQTLRQVVDSGGHLLFLTGAGVSAESGIPTFRGPEGFWTVGSSVYRPEELATLRTFMRDPELVWPWYLWRRQVCRNAAPNPAHDAFVAIERILGDQFTLVTQNVDGLHLRAGNSKDRTFEIHGNIDFYRCSNDCGQLKKPIGDLPGVRREAVFQKEWGHTLECSACRSWMRPHVLWFDESYDERRYRLHSTIQAGSEADILIVAGTTGATSLPAHLLQMAIDKDIPIIDINPNENPFSVAAQRTTGGWLKTSAVDGMQSILRALNEKK